MELVVNTIERLQKSNTKNFLKLVTNDNIIIDNLELGYFLNIKQFLAKLPNYTLLDSVNGVVIQLISNRVKFSHEELRALEQRVVLYYNDVELRNILVRQDNGGKYELDVIIDQEMAAFVLYTFEYGTKDNILGISNLYFDQYKLFKK